MIEDVCWQSLVPRDNVGAGVQHLLCKRGSVDAGLLEVLEHSPRAPAAHEASLERVDSSPNEGDATAIAQSSQKLYLFLVTVFSN